MTGTWDVVVVGAGPAGCLAALSAADAGARTLLVERESLPRYKRCGGGLIGASLDSLPAGFEPPVRATASELILTRDLDGAAHRSTSTPFITMVNRAEFDAALAAHAVAAGVELAEGVRIDAVDVDADRVRLRSSDGEFTAAAVVGADGSTSRIARQVGVELVQTDLGLEVELAADAEAQRRFADTVWLDFGGPSGGYAWVFPKGEMLTVGTIAAKGDAEGQRAYLRRVIEAQGLGHLTEHHAGGHLTRCRRFGAPLGRGRVLVAGDAAGLLEPWTREGISFALRSGRLAGAAAAAIAAGAGEAAIAGYAEAVEGSMGAEMAVGFSALRAFRRHPGAFHRAVASERGWAAFADLCRGRTSLARLGTHRRVRWSLDLLAL